MTECYSSLVHQQELKRAPVAIGLKPEPEAAAAKPGAGLGRAAARVERAPVAAATAELRQGEPAAAIAERGQRVLAKPGRGGPAPAIVARLPEGGLVPATAAGVFGRGPVPAIELTRLEAEPEINDLRTQKKQTDSCFEDSNFLH